MEASQSFAEREGEFLNFLLVASTQQTQLMLKKLTKSQVNAFSEIAYNILHDKQIEGTLLDQLKSHARLIRVLGDRQTTLATRRSLIARHTGKVIKILRLVECLLPNYDVAEICDRTISQV